MTVFAYLAVFSIFFAAIELFARSFFIFLPLMGILVFYATVAFGRQPGFALAVIGGFVMDFVMGYTFPVSSLTFCGVAGLSLLWLHRVVSDSLALHVFPGALIPLIIYVPLSLFYGGAYGLLSNLPEIFLSSLACALMLPFMIIFFDTLNEKLDLKLYSNIQLEVRRT